MKKEWLPGWGYMLLVALLATGLSQLIEVGGKHPVEASLLAILIGVCLRNVSWVPTFCLPGIKAFEKILIWGIVFIGASLNFKTIASQGLPILGIVLTTMIVGFFLIYTLSRLFKLPKTLATLLAIGTTICGGSAIAICAPLIHSKEEQTSYAIGTIALWGLLAIFFYPLIASYYNISDFHFGVFAGTAIHSTPQVVGAGFLYSEFAGKTATAVKLVRNCFMVPIAFVVTFLFNIKEGGGKATSINLAKAFPWFLFGFFIMAGLNTAGKLTPPLIANFTQFGKFLILLGLAGIGLNTHFKPFINIGFKPLIVGMIGSAIVATISITMIHLLL